MIWCPHVSPKAGLHLHTSNRLEALFAELADIVGQPTGSIFQPEIVVVQSVGMGRWLSLRLAEAHGICANVQFPFPQKFIADTFSQALPEVDRSIAFERESLPWRIMQALPGLLEQPEFEPVRHYLAGKRPALKLYQLANKISEVFDRYLAFRPAMILDWDEGKEDGWQAILWRTLAAATPGQHPPALGKKLAATLRAGRRLAQVPARISIFGLSSLPKFYLDIVEAIAAQSAVHLFVMEPTPEWWQHIVSRREESKLLKLHPGSSAAELNLERGNDLLASMGKLGRDFLGIVGDLEPVAHHESFVEPEGATFLSRVQREIFRLQERPARLTNLPDEGSIQFHSCHSPMRELEVLHDQLLAAFENDPALEPRDVVVMMPDVASYAPFIEAVFATPENEKLRIPFAIADRTARAESGVVDTFLALLELSESRFGASSVLSILEAPSVLRRFDLAEADLETIRVWLEKSAVRWGIDGAHRAEFDLPAFSQNSWREGLDRLLLGYAMPARAERLFHGLLPVDEIEGSLAEALGNFVEFADALFQTAAELKTARPLSEWQGILRRVLERFFAAGDEFARELLQIRRALDSLGTISAETGFDGLVPFDVLLAHLHRTVGEADSGAGFLVGRVTFCALKPMRSIPFKVICLVGMNDTAYPRKSAALGFDLMTLKPLPGDRSTRDDDRYLFLEALLSARELFYVSFVGQSLKDGSALPPSVLVSELLDYLGDEEARAALVTAHPLQPFNSAYFTAGSPLFSFSAENCRASTAAEEERTEPPLFFSGLIAPREENEQHTVTLDDLIRFYRNPAEFLLKNRLGIRLPNEEALLEEREPFALGNLVRYQIDQDLLAKSLVGADLSQEEALVRAGGQFPPGESGTAQYRALIQEVAQFAELVRPHAAGRLAEPAPIDLSLPPWRLTGQIPGLTKAGLLAYRLTKAKPLDLLRNWIFHLALNCTAPNTTRLIMADEAWLFPAIAPEICRARLLDLLEIYGRGVSEPIAFFPKASLAFATLTVKRPARGGDPLSKAQSIWEGSGQGNDYPESKNPYIALAFRNVPEPLDEAWAELALRIFQPLLDAREELA